MKTQADPVVVVGAGPAGSVAAHILATKGCNVVLLDAGRGSPDRVEMLPSGAIAAFEAAGLGAFLADRSLSVPCLGIVRNGIREDFLGQPGGRGLAVDRTRLDAVLRSQAVAAGAELRHGRLATAKPRADGIDLVLSGREGIERLGARTVIDATGRAAAAGRRLGAAMVTFQRLTAWPTTWPEQIGPWLAFAAQGDGWRYAITGPDERQNAWHVSPSPAPAHARNAVDASARKLAPAAGVRWIAVGDAAAAFDPICCQGLAHAAGSATVAAGLILADETVCEAAARTYDAACAETAKNAESGRRMVYAAMSPIS